MKKIFLAILLLTCSIFTAEAQVNLSANKDRFCSELNFILSAFSSKELGKIVDYKKPQGLTRSWYEGKAPLTGCEDFSGQNMLGYLTYQGYLSGSKGEGNEKLYKNLVKVIDGCLSGFRKKKAQYGTGTNFISKDNENLKISISYYGEDKHVEISITQSS